MGQRDRSQEKWWDKGPVPATHQIESLEGLFFVRKGMVREWCGRGGFRAFFISTE